MRHTSDAVAIDLVALAILRQEDKLVLVQQQRPNGEGYWVTPGGLVEAGELITDALVREVREEAGVEVTAVGQFVCCSQIDRPSDQAQTIVYMFEVEAWQGVLSNQDPDGEVLAVELVPFDQAVERLRQNGGWPGFQEPLRAYLQGNVSAGALWLYREDAGGQRLVTSVQSKGHERDEQRRP